MLSVVIPTFNRCDTLGKAISGYQTQTAINEIDEILVVDDGSTDSTATVVEHLAQHSPTPIRYFRQQNRGPAAARNVGIREAQSSLVLFTDDDIVPARELVAEHLKWHAAYPEPTAAVLGFVTWSPDPQPTPFMEWYGSEILFTFGRLDGQTEVEYIYFYTCNVSLKKSFLQDKGMFDEDFRAAAYEDIELAFRLSSAGMKLFYNPNAVAYHDQFISFSDACRRYQKSLASAAIFRRKEAGRQPRHSVREISPGTLRLKRWLAPILQPVQPLIDARIPLPWTVYRTMFRIYR